MTTLDRAEPAGPPAPGSGSAAPAASSVVQPSDARPHGPRWRPWLVPPRVRDLHCLAGIALSGPYALAMISLTPALIATRPVLLELLSGSASSIMAAGAFSGVESKLQLTVVIAAALPGMMKFELLFWCAGVLWGHRVAEMLARRSRHAAALARQAEQRRAKFAGPARGAAISFPARALAPDLRGCRLGRPAPAPPVYHSRSHRLGGMGGAARRAWLPDGLQRRCRREPCLALCARLNHTG
jgi:hypothetical protein